MEIDYYIECAILAMLARWIGAKYRRIKISP